MGNKSPGLSLLEGAWFRDKCTQCGLWTIFEMSWRGRAVHADCSACGDVVHFAETIPAARHKAWEINDKVATLELEYPQLATLRRLGVAVELPWFVSRDDDTPPDTKPRNVDRAARI